MTTQEIPSENRTLIDVVLTENAINLEEVVVVGYGTQKKVNLTGAVSNVDSKVLESRPITNLGQGLQGTISNLNITQDNGSLGTSTSFNIRGNTSINGGSPLILVNGIPMDPNLISPNDIDNISVLKDAASAAIYGARAAYGVILITTKSGIKKDKPTVSLSMNYSINQPTIRFEVMDVVERFTYLNQGSLNETGSRYWSWDEYYEAAVMAHYNDPTQPEVFQHPLYPPSIWAYCGNTNWPRVLLRDNYPMQQYSASVSGGTDNFNYYSSFSYLNEEGIAKHFDEKYNRYNFMTNLNYNVTKWLNVGTKISINTSDKKYPSYIDENLINFSVISWPHIPVYLPNGYWAGSGLDNMVQIQEEGGYQSRDIHDAWLTGLIKLTPFKNMTINLDYSFNSSNSKEEKFVKDVPAYNKTGFIGYNIYPSSITKNNSDNKYYAFNAYADYEKTFNAKHYFKIMVGFNQENANK